MEKSGYSSNGVCHSLRHLLNFRADPNLTLVPFKPPPYTLTNINAETGESITYQILQYTLIKVTHGLKNLGIGKGDSVLIFTPNSIHFPRCFLGIATTGAVVKPVSTISQLSKQVKDSNPQRIITVDKVKGFNLLSGDFKSKTGSGSRQCEGYSILPASETSRFRINVSRGSSKIDRQ
uniref:AMP-dependent synthetase/ligase domain-containing protein n=1 Tax=Kalanchoe fedtschenkoi TaxID=63787 RepID=A0A7N0UR97_KALFE